MLVNAVGRLAVADNDNSELGSETDIVPRTLSSPQSPDQFAPKSKLSMLDVFVSLLELPESNKRSGRDHLVAALQEDITAASFARCVSNGKNLLRFALTAVSAENDLSDTEFAIAHAISDVSLCSVYNQLLPSTAEASNVSQRYSSKICAAAWELYQTSNKGAKRGFCYLIDLLKEKLYEGAAVPDIVVNGGKFENCVNAACSRSNNEKNKAKVLDIINKVVHDYPQTNCAELAGSSKYHLDVEGCSDIDVYIHCNDVIDVEQRKRISELIHEKLQYSIGRGVEMMYQRKATTYTWGDVSCDMVFSHASWYPDAAPAPTQGQHFNDKPRLQRAVRALKLLHLEDKECFPRVSGRHIAEFVLHIDDKSFAGIESDRSGVKLFVQCLRDIRTNCDARNHYLGVWQQSVRDMLYDKLEHMTKLLAKMGVSIVAQDIVL